MAQTLKHTKEWERIIQIAREKDLNENQIVFLLAMREAENGPAGFEFGVKAAQGTDLDEQTRWAAASIKKNDKRYQDYLRGEYKGSLRSTQLGAGEEAIDFTEFFAHRGSPTGFGWAPIDEVPDAEKDLNRNWVPNVRIFIDAIGEEFAGKGLEDNGLERAE